MNRLHLLHMRKHTINNDKRNWDTLKRVRCWRLLPLPVIYVRPPFFQTGTHANGHRVVGEVTLQKLCRPLLKALQLPLRLPRHL